MSRPSGSTLGAPRYDSLRRVVALLLIGGIPAALFWSIGWAWADGGTVADLIRKVTEPRPPIESLVTPDDPHVLVIAQAIREFATDPIEQLSIIDDAVADLVDQADDIDTWGLLEHFASVAQMEENRQRHGWAAWRDDCDGKAVLCASVLQNLGYTWRFLQTSEHIWIGVELNERTYEINPLTSTAASPPRILTLEVLQRGKNPVDRRRMIAFGALWPDEPGTRPDNIRPRAGQTVGPIRSDLPRWIGGAIALLWFGICMTWLHRLDRLSPPASSRNSPEPGRSGQ